MKSPKKPIDEDARLETLKYFEVLDSDTEYQFDEITRIVAETMDVPIALISLVDRDRQWFKAHHGLDAEETSRDISFCAHAIDRDGIFVVEDASKDERFFDNPLVTGSPHIRYYAGAPLVTPNGHKIGTLCAIDTRPRSISDGRLVYLETLAQRVVDMFLSRKLRKDIDKKRAEPLRGQSPDTSAAVRDFLAGIQSEK